MEATMAGAPARAPENRGTEDVLRYWRVIAKRKWTTLAVALVTLGGVIAYGKTRVPVYEAIVSVIIDPMAPRILPGMADVVELGSASSGNFQNNYNNTQYRIIQSRSLSERVAERHRLHDNVKLIGQKAAYLPEDQRIVRAGAALRSRLRVVPVKDSRIVNIGVRDADPKLAAQLANQLAQYYVEQNVQNKVELTRGATRWVARQLDEAREDLRKKETALYQFRREHNILTTALEDKQNLVTQQLQEYSTALTSARKQRIDIETRRASTATLLTPDGLEGEADFEGELATLAPLRAEYLESKRRLVELELKYGERHPEVSALRARIDRYRRDMDRRATGILKTMDAEAQALAAAEKRYNAEIAKLTGEAMALSKLEVDYKRLARDAAHANDVYGTLLRRHNESGLQEQNEANNVRILDAALVPSVPVEPNMKLVIAFGCALALLLGLSYAFGVDMLDRSVKSQEDVEQTVGVPFLGFVPTIEGIDTDKPTSAKDLYIVKHAHSTAAESCRVVRTNILFSSPDHPLKTFVISSSNPMEGKTMTCVNLGVVMAQGGYRTLIVDTDMRRPRVHKVLDVGGEGGVSNVIVGAAKIEDMVRETGLPNLFVLPCGPTPPNPAELLQSEKFTALVRELASRYDRVIFDSPPLLAVTDAAILSRVVDGMLLVARAGRTTRDHMIRAKRHVTAVKGSIMGAILNDVNLQSGMYASYYKYYQYRYYTNSEVQGGAAAG